MANPKFLNFSTNLISRDGTSATKDARITNMLVERKGEGETHYIKRPGFVITDGTGWASAPALGATILPSGEVISIVGTNTGTNNGTIRTSLVGVTYATFDPAAKSSNITLSNGNLTATGNTTAAYLNVAGTKYVTSKLRYCEIIWTNINVLGGTAIGIGKSTDSIADGQLIGQTNDGYSWEITGAWKRHSGVSTSFGTAGVSGDVIGMLYDATNGTLVYYKNGVSLGTAYTGITGTYRIVVTGYKNYVNGTINCGATAWAYEPPVGAVGWT